MLMLSYTLQKTLAIVQMKKMFRDIFFGQSLDAETVLEMHYIQRTGSLETDDIGKVYISFGYDSLCTLAVF